MTHLVSFEHLVISELFFELFQISRFETRDLKQLKLAL